MTKEDEVNHFIGIHKWVYWTDYEWGPMSTIRICLLCGRVEFRSEDREDKGEYIKYDVMFSGRFDRLEMWYKNKYPNGAKLDVKST
jgi:hypothetical protein